MIRLQLLGGVRLLDGDGHDIRAVMQQPKRLAVLAFLAVARPRGPQRRDALVGLFWAESDEASARRSLSQTLYFLRQKIHADLFAGRFGEEVGLRESELWCDVVAFEEALDAGRTAEALALYGGDLLPGFHVSDAAEWEKWLDLERDRLRNRAAQAAWSLAAAEEEASHAGAAAHWARWAAALSPYDEKQHRRMLELLVRMGDRAGALRAHDEFARRLATEFEIEPSPETNALVAAIRQDAGGAASGEMVARAARGLERRAETASDAQAVGAARTQPVGPARARSTPGVKGRRLSDAASPAAATSATTATAEHAGRRWRLRTNRRIAVASIVIALASAAYVGVKARAPRSSLTAVAPEQPLDRIGILPFRDLSPDGELGYFADGLATTLADRLAAVERLSVVSNSATRQFASRSTPVDSIGRALNVGSMVAASVSRSGTELRVVVELIDARNGTTLATETLQREQGDMFLLLDSLASSVAWMLRTELGQEIQLRDWNRETESVRAWELVQMSREARASSAGRERASAQASLWTALEYTDEAIELDPGYVKAYIERSRIFQTLLQFHLDDPVRTAAMLDSAEIAANRAIGVDDNAAEALEQRATMRFLSWLFERGGDGEELLGQAEADLRSALASDPHRARSEALLSQILYQRGEFRQAYDAATRAYRADAYAERVEDVLWRLFETSFELGNDDEAAKWCDELRRRIPESWLQHRCDLTLLAFGATGVADPRKALLALDAARRNPQVAQNATIINQFTALVGASYARAGQPDSARAVLNRSLRAAPRDPSVKYIAAAALLRLDDRDRAIELLRDYLVSLPKHTQRVANGRLFATLDSSVIHLSTDTQ